MPVSRYCQKFREWVKVAVKAGVLAESVFLTVQLAITKSNLLWRLIYMDQDLRKEPCPIHKGKWSGVPTIDFCPHGCEHTGWLPNKSD